MDGCYYFYRDAFIFMVESPQNEVILETYMVNLANILLSVPSVFEGYKFVCIYFNKTIRFLYDFPNIFSITDDQF